MIDLPSEHLATVRQILAEMVPDAQLRVFGSRVLGTARPTSDLDLLLLAPERIPLRTMNRLKDAFEESNLPIRVDLIDAHAISAEFRAVVDRCWEPL